MSLRSPLEFAMKYMHPFVIKGDEIVPEFCPFCGGGKSGDRGTFAINIHTGMFNCKRGSCAREGGLQRLTTFFDSGGGILPPQGARFTGRAAYIQPDIELKERTPEINEYFEKRMIFQPTLDAFNVSADQKGNIVFPFYREGILTYVKIRPPYKTKQGEAKEWRLPNTEAILFGMDRVAFDERLVITEGMIDALSLYEAGVANVVSVPNGSEDLTWVNVCWDWLERFDSFLIFGDADPPGQSMVKKLSKMLGEDKCYTVVDFPERPGGSGKICKDPNEVLFFFGHERLKEMADQAPVIELKGILQLADVKRVDFTTVPRILSGIPKLDELMGGFFEGTLTVVTGRRGFGKLLSDDTPIMTDNGYKNHGDLVVGDRVVAPDGEFVKVAHVFPKGEANMRVGFTNGENIHCHEDHEWPVVYRSGSTAKETIMTAKEIYGRRGDRLCGIEAWLRDGSIPAKVLRVSVTSIEYVEPRPGNCIEVEGGFYCAGKTMVVTHNSTLNGTILLNAVEQGKTVFAYSGELSAAKFLDWTLFQAAGGDYISLKYDKYRGKNMPYVADDVAKAVLDWTKGKFFLADNSEIGMGEEDLNIIKVCEQAARRYGCHMFLIDNAMTAVASSSDERATQIRLAKSLKRFAVHYDAAVILVAHPRKQMFGTSTITADDVSGASELTNLADSVFAVERPDIRILKNREEGTNALIECAYCPDSRRVYQLDVGDTYDYSWDKSEVVKPEVVARSLSEFQPRVANKDPI